MRTGRLFSRCSGTLVGKSCGGPGTLVRPRTKDFFLAHVTIVGMVGKQNSLFHASSQRPHLHLEKYSKTGTTTWPGDDPMGVSTIDPSSLACGRLLWATLRSPLAFLCFPDIDASGIASASLWNRIGATWSIEAIRCRCCIWSGAAASWTRWNSWGSHFRL